MCNSGYICKIKSKLQGRNCGRLESLSLPPPPLEIHQADSDVLEVR